MTAAAFSSGPRSIDRRVASVAFGLYRRLNAEDVEAVGTVGVLAVCLRILFASTLIVG